MEQQILGLNTFFEDLKYEGFSEESFSYNISLLDYDAVIINAELISLKYPSGDGILEDKTYNNKRRLTKDASCAIEGDCKRIREQLMDLLKQGKNVFVLMGNNENCYICDEKKRQPMKFDTFSFLPLAVDATFVMGTNITYCCNSPYIDFFNRTNDCNYYASYFSTLPNSIPLAKIKGSDKVVSSIIEYEQGKIIFLPHTYCEEEYSNEKTWKKYGKIYLDSLFDLSAQLRSEAKTYVLPTWTEQFSILNEKKHIQSKNSIEQKINKLNKDLKKQEVLIQNIQKYKRVLTASGDVLEEIINQVLSELGFVLSDTELGRDDIIAKYNDIDVVAEIKGVKKSAAEKHAAQLEKWASTFLEKNEHEAKPILIVNGYCEMPLQERKEPVFPAQMLPFSTARNHALISTTQLLCLYIETKNNPSCKEERIAELLNTVGVYERYENIYDYIKLADETGELDG